MGSIGWAQLLIIAVIVVLLFGTNKLRTLGSDLGASIKGFKKRWEMIRKPHQQTLIRPAMMLTLRNRLQKSSSP